MAGCLQSLVNGESFVLTLAGESHEEKRGYSFTCVGNRWTNHGQSLMDDGAEDSRKMELWEESKRSPEVSKDGERIECKAVERLKCGRTEVQGDGSVGRVKVWKAVER